MQSLPVHIALLCVVRTCKMEISIIINMPCENYIQTTVTMTTVFVTTVFKQQIFMTILSPLKEVSITTIAFMTTSIPDNKRFHGNKFP